MAIDYEQFQHRRVVMRDIGPTTRYKRQMLGPVLRELKNMTVLDVGCGSGEYSETVMTSGSIAYPLDISLSGAQRTRARCGENVKPLVASAEQLPYRDEKFDAVLCFDVLEHCEHDGKAAAEISRVLKPDGLAIITVPINPALFNRLDETSGHVRRYTEERLFSLLQPYFQIREWWDYGWPVMSVYRKLLNRVSGTVSEISANGQPSVPTRLVASLAFAAMQIDRLFQGNGRGIQIACVATKSHDPRRNSLAYDESDEHKHKPNGGE